MYLNWILKKVKNKVNCWVYWLNKCFGKKIFFVCYCFKIRWIGKWLKRRLVVFLKVKLEEKNCKDNR